MTPLTRRHFLGSAGAVAALQLLPGCATRRSQAGGGSVDALLTQMAEQILAEYPENATALGLDKDARAGLKSQAHRPVAPWPGRALAGAAADRLRRLQAVDRTGLDPSERIHLGVAETAHALAVEGFRFPYGDVVTLNQQWSYRNAPYVVAQNTGAFVEMPDFLDSNHTVANRGRRRSLSGPAGGLCRRARRRDRAAAPRPGIGVVAPDFLLDKTLRSR